MGKVKVDANSKLSLGVEFGSTRIKAVLIDENQAIVATGSVAWENQLVAGVWTYDLDDVWRGLQTSYAQVKKEVNDQYGFTLKNINAIGFSAMMHGYLALDKEGALLAEFRTWRNSLTSVAAKTLTKRFDFNIPERWSIAHLYQAILNAEEHVKQIACLTTLAGYVHFKLTGRQVLGIGDASGMFPIDLAIKDYHEEMVDSFDELVSAQHYPWKLRELLPEVLVAGQPAGKLTPQGAKLIDPTGDLIPGCPLCPPEGDAGTGMVATNSIRPKTGNISAGTSVFAMVVLEKSLSKVYPEIDLVATPIGDQVAMVHANNCSFEINAWVWIFGEFLAAAGISMSEDKLYQTLFEQSLKGDLDAGGLLSYGYLSGENITKMPAGRPLLVRTPSSNFNLANLMRVNLYTAFGAMYLGMRTLTKTEQVKIDELFAHGGIFKTAGVAGQILASAINTPVSVMKTAAVGGAWGMALLADYLDFADAKMTLEAYLEQQVFANMEVEDYQPVAAETAGFARFAKRYEECLPLEAAAIENFKLEN